MICLENARHLLNQSDVRLGHWSLAFSRAYRRSRLFAMSSHWLLVILNFVLIGCCDKLLTNHSSDSWIETIYCKFDFATLAAACKIFDGTSLIGYFCYFTGFNWLKL